MLSHGLEQRPLDFAPREVSGVHHSPRRMTPLARQIERAGGSPRKPGSDIMQPLDGRRASAHTQVDDPLVAQARSSPVCVTGMLLEGITVGKRRRHAPLRPPGGRVATGPLGDQNDLAVSGGSQRKTEAGDAGAEHQIISLVHRNASLGAASQANGRRCGAASQSVRRGGNCKLPPHSTRKPFLSHVPGAEHTEQTAGLGPRAAKASVRGGHALLDPPSYRRQAQKFVDEPVKNS